MIQPTNRWNEVQRLAKLFLSRPAYQYSTFDTDKLPQTGGVYLLCLVDESLNETPLYINFTSNLRNEILIKRAAFIISQTKSPKKLSEVLNSRCYLRYMVESDPKEQMALTVAISLELKPSYLNN